jgi:hypothetical protein
MPNTTATAATRKKLHCGTTTIGSEFPSVGQCGSLPFLRIKFFLIQYAALAGLSGGWGWQGGWLHRFWLVGFLPTGCRSLVHGIRLVLLRAGNVESNPGPDRGPCVVCGKTPAENAKVLLRCREGCGRKSHNKEACSGPQRGEQRQGNWVCGMCMVVNGGMAHPKPQSNQVPPPVAFSQPLSQGSLSSQPGPST